MGSQRVRHDWATEQRKGGRLAWALGLCQLREVAGYGMKADRSWGQRGGQSQQILRELLLAEVRSVFLPLQWTAVDRASRRGWKFQFRRPRWLLSGEWTVVGEGQARVKAGRPGQGAFGNTGQSWHWRARGAWQWREVGRFRIHFRQRTDSTCYSFENTEQNYSTIYWNR